MGNFRKARLPAAIRTYTDANGLPKGWLDSKTGLYFVPFFKPASLLDFNGVNFSRASAGWAEVNRVITEFAAGVPRIGDGGVLLEGATTNKAQAYAEPTVSNVGANVNNAAPGASGVLTVADDAAALESAGLDGITNGSVYRLDNSAGTGESRISFNGVFDTTGNACWSAYVRIVSGGGTQIKLRTAFGAYPFISGLDGSFKRFEQSTPTRNAGSGNANDLMWVAAQAGEIIHVCLPQSEEARLTATSYFPTDGAAATRAADSLTFDCSALGWADDQRVDVTFEDDTTTTLTASSGVLTIPASAKAYSLLIVPGDA